ncbi:helix-turn-helix domain-containing protein [Aliiroseovarius sp. S2029]|uniref:helix-turn-helix domain-containing protein n=1 Tax=Aliiroseovarius sp. S2029 TaxID=2936988 RepID=UPI0020BDC71F|nr:helix-turn-helix domain-containing protein [Aliiroseovarius sp. S2029]MCK8483920.1 helix-turn-helix domain-containing protein [Aliiroseovarius sp. S2029]
MYVTLPTVNSTIGPVLSLQTSHRNQAETRLKAGSYLYYEGDKVNWLYQVKSGVLRLARLLEDGRRQVIAFGYPGDVVGFPSDGLHHTDCDALADARLQPLHRSALEHGGRDDKLHALLLEAAMREISAMQDHFMMLGHKSAVEKVASFLSVLIARHGTDQDGKRQIDLPMPRADIADFLCLSTETVCRTFAQFHRRGIIAVDNIYTIILLQPEALVALSKGDAD